MFLSLAFSPAQRRLVLDCPYTSPRCHINRLREVLAQADEAQAQAADNSDFIAFLPQASEDQFPREKILYLPVRALPESFIFRVLPWGQIK